MLMQYRLLANRTPDDISLTSSSSASHNPSIDTPNMKEVLTRHLSAKRTGMIFVKTYWTGTGFCRVSRGTGRNYLSVDASHTFGSFGDLWWRRGSGKKTNGFQKDEQQHDKKTHDDDDSGEYYACRVVIGAVAGRWDEVLILVAET